MMYEVGWILDVYTEGNLAIIWIRTEDNKVIRLQDLYYPSLYVLAKKSEEGEELLKILGNQTGVRKAAWVEKYTNLMDRTKKRLIHVVLEDVSTYRNVVNALKEHDHVVELFNTTLLHVQRYLFMRLKVEPTSKVEFLSDTSRNLAEINKVDDSKEIEPSPFTVLHFDMNIRPSSLVPNPQTDPITSIRARFEDEEILIEGSEEHILKSFESVVRETDPDFIVTRDCDNFVFPYLRARAQLSGLKVHLGRENADSRKVIEPISRHIRGRVVIDYQSYGVLPDGWGIAGLVERSRFGCLPLGLAARWSANRVNDSRICYELIQRDYVIPKSTGYYEYVRSMKEIFERDRGSMIIPPKTGVVHANVAELDYESEYPNLIVKDCISFETVSPRGLNKRDGAILPSVTKKFLERRLYFKRLRQGFPKESDEWLWCEQRQNALKSILVCLYGTSGCCWNRFGNVMAFEEINKKSRQTMVKTKDYVQSLGFELIYADTDSIFIRKDGATKEDYVRLAEQLSGFTGMPVSLAHQYKFLVLLPLETGRSLNMGAQKRYFGILHDGEIIARGIELRRHDTPPFIKGFQADLIKTLFDCMTVGEVYTLGYGRAITLVTKAIEKILDGDVSPRELSISKMLRKHIVEYKNISSHVAAAIQLLQKGKPIEPGENVNFIHVNSNHKNSISRVSPLELIHSNTNIDKEKYRDMLLDASETILSTFGFSRDIYKTSVKLIPWLK